jgi:hypothetical protein
MERVLESFGAVSLNLSGKTKKHYEKPQYRPSPRWGLNPEPSTYGAGTSTSTVMQPQNIYVYIHRFSERISPLKGEQNSLYSSMLYLPRH